jgi:hypothetical protein
MSLDHPAIRETAALRQEIENYRGTVEGLEAELSRVKAERDRARAWARRWRGWATIWWDSAWSILRTIRHSESRRALAPAAPKETR